MSYFSILDNFTLKVAPKPIIGVPDVPTMAPSYSIFMLHTVRQEVGLGSFVPYRYFHAYTKGEIKDFPFTPLTLQCYQRQFYIDRMDQRGNEVDICHILEKSLKIFVNYYEFESLYYCKERRGWFLQLAL